MTPIEYLNPSTAIIIPTKKDLTQSFSMSRGELPKYWDKEYINQQIDATKNHEHRMLLQFLWMTGCRIGEVVGVQKNDIDFQNYIVRIRWLKSRRYQYRNIPLYPKLRDILQVYTATMKIDQRVFPITRQRAWQIVQKNLNGHPHQFRHSFAINWLRSGGDIVTLSKMLGHSKITTTMEYLKIVPIDQGKELLKVKFD